MKRQLGTGSSSSSRIPLRTPASIALSERFLVEAAGLGEDGELEPGPGDRRQLDRGRRLRCELRESLTHDVADPFGAVDLRESPRQLGAVAELESAALAQVAPQLAEEQRGAVGEAADRRDELLRRLHIHLGAHELAHFLNGEIAERESAQAVYPREVAERIREGRAHVLTAVAVGSDDQQPLGSHPRQPC